MSQSCSRFELRAKKNEASSRKGTAGKPGNITPSAAKATEILPSTINRYLRKFELLLTG